MGTLNADDPFWMDSSSKQTQNIGYVVPAYCRIVRWRTWADQFSPPPFLFLSLSFTSLCILIGFCAPCCSCCLHTGGVLDLDICAEECKIGSILVPTRTHLSFFANSHLCRSRTRLMLIVHNGIAYKPTLVRQ